MPEESQLQHFYCKLHACEQLFSDLVDARGVPDATLLLQFTYIGGRRPTGNRGSGGTDALPDRACLLFLPGVTKVLQRHWDTTNR